MARTKPAPVQKPPLLMTGAAVFAPAFCAVLTLSLALSLNGAHAQDAATVKPTKPVASAAASSAAGAAHTTVSARPVRDASKPTWSELTPQQQQALAPLAANWGTISEAQKRKWLEISKSYPNLPPTEQATMRSRMTEWAALSAKERAHARLNFGQTTQIAPADKQAKWQAYQALPPEEKKKLADKAQAKPPNMATAVKPVSPAKLATVPHSPQQKIPRLAGGPNQVDHNTLLPSGGTTQNH